MTKAERSILTLLFFPANQAYAVLCGRDLRTATLFHMDNAPMFFPKRSDAVEAAKRLGLTIKFDGQIVPNETP